MQKFQIYALIDPRDNIVQYIGKTITSLNRRLTNHVYKAKSGRDQTKKGDWIRELLDLNLKPKIVSFYTGTTGWKKVERYFIEQLEPPLNLCAGGNGSHVRISLNNEIIERLGKEPDTKIAKELGCSRENVTYHRTRLGIPACWQDRTYNFDHRKGKEPHNKIHLPEDIIARLGKESAAILAKEAGCSTTTINTKCKELGIPTFKQVPFKGEEHGCAKLTEKEVKTIREMYQNGVSNKEISENFKINYAHCCAITSGKAWKHS